MKVSNAQSLQDLEAEIKFIYVDTRSEKIFFAAWYLSPFGKNEFYVTTVHNVRT